MSVHKALKGPRDRWNPRGQKIRASVQSVPQGAVTGPTPKHLQFYLNRPPVRPHLPA